MFVREQAGWAFLGQSQQSLQAVPNAPTAQLEGLEKQYDIAVRARISNIPPAYKQMAKMLIEQGMKAQMNQQMAQNDVPQDLQQKLAENQAKQFDALLNEIDQLTIGWSTDSQAKSTRLDLSFSAVPGTNTAQQLASMNGTKSSLAGFLQPDAALTMNLAAQIPAADIEESVTMLESFRQTAKQELAKDVDLPDQKSRDAAAQLLDGVFEVIRQTIQSGKMDFAGSVNLAPKSLTAMAAGHVADGAKVEGLLQQLVELAKDDPQVPKIQFNADQHAGVRFHTLSVDVPDEEGRKVLGDRLDLVVGIGPTTVYGAAGPSGLQQLKAAIDRSASAKETSVLPFQLKAAVGSILQFASSVDENPSVAAIAGAVAQSGGNDHVSITATPTSEGVTYRLELQEGRAAGHWTGKPSSPCGAGAGRRPAIADDCRRGHTPRAAGHR